MHMSQVIQINRTKNKGSKKGKKGEKTIKQTEQNPSLLRFTFKESFQKGGW